MNILYKIPFIVLLLALAGLISPFTSYAAPSVTFSGGAPLNTYQPKVIIPILKEAFRRNGVIFNAEHNPSLRSLQLSNSGIVDGELHRVFNFHKVSNGEYPNLVRIESQLLSIWVTAFATKEFEISNWADLSPHQVAYYRGRKNVENFLKGIMPSKNIQTVNHDKQAFRLLANNRIEIVISELKEGINIIKSSDKFKNIREIARLDETKIYAYIHKKHKDLASQVAQALEEMKKDGTFKRLLKSSVAE